MVEQQMTAKDQESVVTGSIRWHKVVMVVQERQKEGFYCLIVEILTVAASGQPQSQSRYVGRETVVIATRGLLPRGPKIGASPGVPKC